MIKNRIYKISALIITTGLGFFLKYINCPFSNFFNNSLAGSAYVVFWIILANIIFPKIKPLKIAVAVTLLTSILECIQLLDTPSLNYLRKFWLGKTILGTTFTITDFPYYIIGGVAGFFMLKFLSRIK